MTRFLLGKLTSPPKIKIRSVFLLMMIFTISTISLNAQPGNQWTHFYDINDETNLFHDVFYTVEGNYAMSGVNHVGNNSGFWIVTADVNGEELWQRTYVDQRFRGVNNRAFSLIQTEEGGFLFGGEVTDEDGSRFSLLRTDSEGERMWWRNYSDPEWSAQCHAVIELKSGEFVAVGRSGEGHQAYAVMVDGIGDILWENVYEGNWLWTLREVGDGLLMGGRSNENNAWLLKTNFEGDALWSRSYGRGMITSLISCREGGFAATGHRTGGRVDWLLLRVDGDCNQLWATDFDFGDREWGFSLVQMRDNGFTIVGNASSPRRNAIIRTDLAGNEQWRRIDGNEQERFVLGHQSVIASPDGSAVVASIGAIDGGSIDGVLINVALMFSPPEIVYFSPEELEFTVLQGDTVEFFVQAEDFQDDSLYYCWTVEEDTVSTDTLTTLIFEELDDHIMECFVSDSMFADSVAWLVHVEEFFIRNYEPDSLDLIVQRGTEIDFGIDVTAIEEIEVEKIWNLTHRDRRQEEIGDADAVSVTFDQSGRHQLQALVSHEDENDEVTWTIIVRSAIWSWWPSELELSTYVDSTLEFVITPFNEESDSLEFSWLFNPEPLESDSASVHVTFLETGQYEITSIVRDGFEADTIRWTVDVEEWSFTTDLTDLTDLPTSPVLYPANPNPFNSSVKLSIYLPHADQVLLAVFDVNGREVSRLVDGDVASGNQTFVWNASDFPAGVHVVRMNVGKKTEMRKVVLVR